MIIQGPNSTPLVAPISNKEAAAVAQPAAAPAAAPADGVVLSGTNAPAAPAAPAAAPTTGAAPADGKPPVKDWTVMVWVASDNNLYQYQVNNLTDAEKVGTTPQMNVVAQISRVPDGGGCQRIAIEKQPDGNHHSPVLQELGSTNMGDPKNLADFIKWTKANYPANHYMLVLNDHGNGWQGTCEDESHDGWLTLPKLEESLKEAREATDGKPLDVVGFDACLMANVETADQLKDETKYLVGSEETEGGAGWQYNKVLSGDVLRVANSRLATREGLSAEQLAKTSVAMAKGDNNDLPTMAAFDTSKASTVVAATKAFGDAIVKTNVDSKQLAQVAQATQAYTMEKDLYDFADRVSNTLGGSDANLKSTADTLKTDINSAIIAEQHSSKYPNSHGLTVELNKNFDSRDFRVNQDPSLAPVATPNIQFDTYQHTKFDQDTGWDKAVSKIAAGGSIDNPWGGGGGNSGDCSDSQTAGA